VGRYAAAVTQRVLSTVTCEIRPLHVGTKAGLLVTAVARRGISDRVEHHARRSACLSAREPQGEYLEWAELDGHCAVVNGKCRLIAPALE
jgi:hypothetical protein